MTVSTMGAGRRNVSVQFSGRAISRLTTLSANLTAALLCTALGSCSLFSYNDFDTAGNVSKKEYADLMSRRAPEPQARGEEPPIPGFQGMLAAPSAPELADTRRVSIAVTETTPVRDILIELARKAQTDLELDPRISGGIIMTATDRPFIDVIATIAELAELRFRFAKNTLKVEIDDPYLEQYRMNILNLARTASTSASSSTDASSVAQAIGSGGGGGGGNKSSSDVTSQTSFNFWSTIGANINHILAGITTRRGQASSIAATFVPEPEMKAAPAPSTAAKPAPAGGSGAAATAVGQAAALGNRQAGLDAVTAQDQGQPPAAANDQPEIKAQALVRQAGSASVAAAQYSLNPEAGIITVFASQRQHKAVERYLRSVYESVTQQVLIDARVIEVSLSDQYRSGINWTSIFGPNSGNSNLNVTTNFTRNVVPPDFTGPTLVANWANGLCVPGVAGCVGPQRDLSLAVQLVKEFGAVRTLSSPRLTVLNNQVAILKVAQNQVFFQLEVNTSDATSTTAAKTTVDSQIKTVPVGLIINVMPTVDPVTKRISLNLRPSITRITGFVNDPGVAVTIAVAQSNNPNSSIPAITSPIPIIEVREMDSMVTMESGQTVVMGGLMQEEVQTKREGLPGVMDLPIIGQAVAENIKQNKVTELVVFIQATVVDAAGTVSDEDIRLYKTFAPDPRPIAF